MKDCKCICHDKTSSMGHGEFGVDCCDNPVYREEKQIVSSK